MTLKEAYMATQVANQNRLVNLTPHAITVIAGEHTVTVPPSGDIARVSTVETLISWDGHVPIYRQSYGETVGLPPAQDRTRLIVSSMVRLANQDRWDLLSPVGLVRNKDGQPIGCNGLVANS